MRTDFLPLGLLGLTDTSIVHFLKPDFGLGYSSLSIRTPAHQLQHSHSLSIPTSSPRS